MTSNFTLKFVLKKCFLGILEVRCPLSTVYESLQSCSSAFSPEDQIGKFSVTKSKDFVFHACLLSLHFHGGKYTFDQKVTISGLLSKSVTVPMHEVNKAKVSHYLQQSQGFAGAVI